MRSESTKRGIVRALGGLGGVLALGLFLAVPTQPAHADWHGGHGWGGGWHGGGWHGGWGWGGGWGCCGWGWGWGWPGVGISLGWPGYYAPYYYPPYPAYAYAPGYAPAAPAVTAPTTAAPSCKPGTWRYQDGSTVTGTACLQSDGTWKMSQ